MMSPKFDTLGLEVTNRRRGDYLGIAPIAQASEGVGQDLLLEGLKLHE